MEAYDLIIVGGGPAGSTAAYYSDGMRVLIVDKNDFPRNKACGGGLMSSKDWDLEFENYAKIKDKLKSYFCDSIRMYWNNFYITGRKLKHLLDQVDRFEFDSLLLEEALKKENVSFLKFDVEKIQKVKINGEKGFILSDGERKIFSSYLIGADGIYSKVSIFLGNKHPKIHQFGHCMEYDVACEKKTKDVHVSPGYKCEIGYSWIFPTASGYQVGLGVTRKPRKSLKIYLDEYLDWAVKDLIPEKYEIARTLGGAIPLKIVRKFCTERVMLCGDALGAVKQLTGEGIYYAMKSGKIAGEVISKNRNEIEKSFRKKIRPIVREVYLIPYIPPKIFTITFWTTFFYVSKFLEKMRVFNLLINFFMKKAIHRLNTEDSFYKNEKIERI